MMLKAACMSAKTWTTFVVCGTSSPELRHETMQEKRVLATVQPNLQPHIPDSRNHALSRFFLIATWRYFVSDLQAGLKQNGWKFGVALSCQPQSEVFMRLKSIQLFFKCRKPCGDKMQVFQAQPLMEQSCKSWMAMSACPCTIATW